MSPTDAQRYGWALARLESAQRGLDAALDHVGALSPPDDETARLIRESRARLLDAWARIRPEVDR